MRKALVLGGGGVTGIAWQVGLLLGLKRAGVDAGNVDLIVGTSAGSVTGSLLALGVDLEHSAAEQQKSDPDEQPIHANMARVMSVFGVLFDATKKPREARIEVGKMALAEPVGDEATYLRRFSRRLGSATWPTSPRLLITGVDAVTGEAIAWDQQSEVPLLHAVAASCAVPCIFPPVTIGAARYMDGGVRSTINADLAVGAEAVLVIAPMLAFTFSWKGERAKLGDAKVVVVGPDAAASDAIGPNVMDTSRRNQAFHAGLSQAAAVAVEAGPLFGRAVSDGEAGGR